MTDRRGRIACQTSTSKINGDFPKFWGLEEALRGEDIVATGYTPQGWAVCAMAPLHWQGRQNGVLMLGIYLNDAFAREIAEATNTQISFSSPFQILASSWPPDRRQVVAASWVNRSIHEKRSFFFIKEQKNISSFFVPLEIERETVCLIINTDTTPIYLLLQAKKRQLFLSFLLVLGAILILGSGLTFYIIRPLRRLHQRALGVIKDFSGKDLPAARGGNEVETLSQAMEVMLATIQARFTELEEAHEALQERETFLASVFASIQDELVVMDRDFTILQVNPSMEQRFAESMPLVGRKCYTAFHGYQQACQDCPTSRAMETGKTAYQIVSSQQGETVRWVEHFAFPLRDLASGQVTGAIEYARDITEKQQAEEALQEARRDWEEIFQAIGQPTFLMDPEQKIVAANRAALHALQRPLEEILGRRCYEIMHVRQDGPAPGCPVEKMMQSGRMETQEMEVEALEGTFLVSCTPVLDQQGSLRKIIHIATDITARKQAEQALQESEEKYRLLVNQIPAVVFRGYADGSLETFDRKIEDLAGYPKEDFDSRRRKWSDLVLEEDLPLVKGKFLAGLKTTGTYEQEYRIRKRSGEIIWVQVRSQIFLDSAGRIDYVSGVIFDITARKKAEENLRKYEFIANTTRDSMTLIDRHYILEAANAAYCQRLGKTREEVVGQSLAAIWGQDIFNAIIKKRLDLCFSGQPVEYEDWFPFGKQRRGCFRVSLNPYFDEDGTVAYAAVVSHDVTDRRRAEEELRKERDLTLSIIDSLPGTFYLFDGQGKFLRWNKSMEVISQYSFHEIAGMHALDFFADHDKGRVQEAIQTAFTRGEASVEAELVFKDGGRRAFFFTGRRILMDDKPFIVGMGMDISQRRQMEVALRERESMLSLVINTVPQAIFWKDLDSVYLGCNRVYSRAAGLESPAAVVGKNEHDLPWGPEEIANCLAEDREVMQTRQTKYHQLKTLRLADGRQIWVDGTKTALLDGEGEVIGVLGVYEDITERKQLEEALQESERRMLIREKMASLGQVAAGIAHEIRNPLSGINVYLESIKEDFRDPGNAADIVELIEAAQSASNKIEGVIKRVLDFSRPADLRFAPTDINAAADDAIKLVATKLRKENIKIDSSLAPDLPLISADKQLLGQALINMIANAAEAMRGAGEPGRIHLATQAARDAVLITIEDSGPGIPAAIREKIFEPYFTTKSDGSGIGLSLCQRIINDHGGKIEVSSGDAGGARFVIRLPKKRWGED